MAGIKSLAKETAVYGLSSIVGRFLNWCLVPLYVYLFPTEEYGIVSYLYSFTAVMLVILNYGMETGFFRFVSARDEQNPDRVYTTSLISVGTTSLLFITLISIFIRPASCAIRMGSHPLYVWLLGVTIALDAFSNIPFAYLRYKKRALRFAAVKLTNIGVNIGLNLFFLLACPAIQKACPGAIDWFYAPLGGRDFGIGWIFVANILSTIVNLLMLSPELPRTAWRFSAPLLRRMLRYSWPLLILGVTGIMSQNMGQIIIPYLFTDQEAARSMVGIYGANIKIAIVMVMFTQAFRYAYEPFIFAKAREAGTDQKQVYCDAMKFFVIFGLFIFLGVMFFLPVLKYFIAPPYWPGLRVVPVMMLAELFFGVFFNLSLWYKLTDRTLWGMYFSIAGFVIMAALNVWWVRGIGVPDGYIGSAWAALVAYFIIMTLSYVIGRRYYPLPYQTGRMALYTAVALGLWAIGSSLCAFPTMPWLMYTTRVILLCLFLALVYRIEFRHPKT